MTPSLTTETDSPELMAHRGPGTIARDDAKSHPIISPDQIHWIVPLANVSAPSLDHSEDPLGLANISRDWNGLTHIDYMGLKSTTPNLRRHETGHYLPRHRIWKIGDSDGVEFVDLKNMIYGAPHLQHPVTTSLDLESYHSPRPFMMSRIATGEPSPWINFLIEAEKFLGIRVIDPAKPDTQDSKNDTRIQSNISLFARPNETGRDFPVTTIPAIENVVAWLRGREASIFTAVSEDGLLSISATFQSGVRLFIEVDRDGSSEATVATSRTHVEAIAISTVEDLTPKVLATTIGSP